MTDIVFVTAPKVSPETPPAGPAVLKSYLLTKGIQSKYLDWNKDFFELCKDETKYWNFGTVEGNNLQDKEFDRLWSKHIASIKEYFLTNVLSETKFLGISLFSFESHHAAEKLCRLFKEIFPDKKIIIGGPGANGVTEKFLTQSICDYSIPGDGEEALVHLLQGKEHQGINSYYIDRSVSMDEIPVGNFDDLDLKKYKGGIYIRTSKGCVLNCTFCDVRSLWPKYQFQSPQKTIKDLRTIRDKYPEIIDVKFADSLLNASMSKYRELLELMAVEKFPMKFEAKIIIRPSHQMIENDYKLMKEANFHLVLPGVESGSEQVRAHMGKIFSNQDLEFFLDNMQKYQMKALFLFIIGYITETEEDFQETLNLITLINTKYPNVVPTIAMGEQLFVLPGSPLYDRKNEFDVFDHTYWVINGNTKAIREDRNNRLIEHATKMNIRAVCRKASEGDTVLKYEKKLAG